MEYQSVQTESEGIRMMEIEKRMDEMSDEEIDHLIDIYLDAKREME